MQFTKCDNKIKQVFFIFKLRGTLANRKDLQALTLAGPTSQNSELAPLAVLRLNNRLNIYCLQIITCLVGLS